jgi:hypothetical protein
MRLISPVLKDIRASYLRKRVQSKKENKKKRTTLIKRKEICMRDLQAFLGFYLLPFCLLTYSKLQTIGHDKNSGNQ